jgi:SAM-dependent methyltransferase
MNNIDQETVEGFGDEWTRFDQSELSDEERRTVFDEYFSEFPWDRIGRDAVGFDAGCGSGRWALLAAPRVGKLHAVDASEAALAVARRNLAALENVAFHQRSIDDLPFEDGSMDFGYSLGVLHHMPDTRAAIAACVRKLKEGAPLLLYLYYAFDNRPRWFRAAWQVSDFGRRVISRMPYGLRFVTTQAIAASVYWPLARSARVLERFGLPVDAVPLSFYRDRSFYVMRTDALDRFGTQLEQRFTRDEIREMMESAGLESIRFRDGSPYWCAVGFKARKTAA